MIVSQKILQEHCLDQKEDLSVFRLDFVNLLKVVLALMAQKVALQMQLWMLIPSAAILDSFLLVLFELLNRRRTESFPKAPRQ
jgi:hypothetical protein